MRKPISPMVHGLLDYYTAPTLHVLPRIMGWEKKLANFMTASGLFHLSYSLITRYELGLFKLLPMRGHLAIDGIFAAATAASPFVLLRREERSPLKTSILIGLSIYEFVVVLLTEPESPATEKRPEIRSRLEERPKIRSRLRELVTSGR